MVGKRRFIVDDNEKKICKIVFRGKDVDSGLRDYLKSNNPSMLIDGSSTILGEKFRCLHCSTFEIEIKRML